jgi:HAD superfamily hydrolase (TIGR01509 family)
MTDPKPEVAVFDLGKVLVDFDYGISARKLATRSRVSAAVIREHIDHSSLLFRYETGLLTSREFYQEVCAFSGFAGAFGEFADTFADIFQPMDEMVALHASLRARGLPTYIFSNTNELAVNHIRRKFPFFSDFDDYVYSYEQGSMKPEARIYEVVERTTGRSGPAILYIDDRPENVEAGAARGWRVILQREPAETIRLVKEMGLT